MNALTWPAGSESPPRHLRMIRAYPMLSAEEELALSRAWRDRQDPAAAHNLVTSHLRLVARIAAGYRRYGLPMSDLISEGSVGMVRALQGFDPERGLRLATYARWWIRSAMQEYILHSRSLVKMGTTAAQRKLFFNLSRLKDQIHATEDGDLHADQVAKIVTALGVPEHDVISMNRRLAARDHSLNSPRRRGDDDQWQDRLVDDACNQETLFAEREELADRKMLLNQTFNVLNKREQHIVTERWLKEDMTPLDVLAARYGTSREQVRQTEIRALAKLRKAVKARMTVRVVRAATTELPGAST